MQVISWIVSIAAFFVCFFFQRKYFRETKKFRELFCNFFYKTEKYETEEKGTENGEVLTQLKLVGKKGSDLNVLIEEINHYVMKTKGTTDFSVIQNKVERKLNMRYDQSVAKLSFPTYIGLMGTFLGVFTGVLMFIVSFDSASGITDTSIKNLLIGVLVSMSTSLVGLAYTTISNAKSGEARKKIEEDKNEFYDFVQTELMPSLDVSMVAAITKLHETVDRFEPAFDRVINRFQTTFDNCTQAFGNSFEQNVKAVASAVDVMGKNMDKINENIDLQERLLATLKSGELVQGLDRYIEASNNFVSITQSLNKFEEARRMMLAATQEAINIQNAYSDSLQIPREVAVRINQILDRIKEFEENVNRVGGIMNRREILGNDVVNAIEDQLKGISKKGKIADKYLEMADGRLEDLFTQQTRVISEMNRRYKEALEGHIEGFEKMIERQTEELENRHKEFMKAIEERLAIEDVRQEFVNLGKLKDIDGKMAEVSRRVPTSDEIQKAVQKAMHDEVQPIQKELDEMKNDFRKQMEESKSGVFGGLFGRR
ncbi:MAG: hypothetical protein K6A94_07120 [Bacteroidales bacterium]|nr:hypothetical protein [Bacteroidales bacterium]